MEIEIIIKKLNLKSKVNAFVVSPPDAIQNEILRSDYKHLLVTDIQKIEIISFALCFVESKSDLNTKIEILAPLLEGDAILWFAYPKKSSKNYNSDISRDSGWEEIGNYNMEPVRQISIDEDWSALRFRKIDFIKNLNRNPEMLLSKKGDKS